jgi:hypothetical protein
MLMWFLYSDYSSTVLILIWFLYSDYSSKVLMLIWFLYFDYGSVVLIYLIAYRINGIFSKSGISPYIAASVPAKKRRIYQHIWERRCRDNFFSSPCNSETSTSADISQGT